MARFVEMDELVTISEQMEEDIDPIHINQVDVDEFLKRWAADDTAFKQQPRFISAQLHRVLRAAVQSSTMLSGSPPSTSKGL